MKYTFACKRVPLNDSIKEYAQKKISKLERYFREEDTTAFVTFSVEKDHLWRSRSAAAPRCCGHRRRLLTEICAAPLTPLWDISSGRF